MHVSLINKRYFWHTRAIATVGGCLCFGIALLAGMSNAGALTYSKEFCGSVRKTRTSLVKAGVLVDMTKGPAWAKDNLTPEKLARIKRYLRIEEIVQFQCAKIRRKKAKPKTKPKSKTQSKTKPTAKRATKRRPVRPAKRKARTKPVKK